MNVDEFDYELPNELIAQTPYLKRDEARLLTLDSKSGKMQDLVFKNIIDYLEKGDCLVINDTKVIPARIYGRKETGAHVEVLLLKNLENDIWQAMVKPGGKLKVGAKIFFGNLDDENLVQNAKLKGEIIDIEEDGLRKIKFSYDGIFNEILDEIGLMPLPPYIVEELKEKDAYQTVYAKYEGSAAAPTAGLHFTKELLEKIEEKGVDIAKVTLHVGIGTFRPVKVDTVENHKMHSEKYIVTKEAADKINKAKENGKRVICVGTTSCRTVESASDENGKIHECSGDTEIFIYPGYKFKVMDALITNFHLPKSTLVMLVSALAGKENILNAYKHAVEEKYKFFSFGDAMYIY